MSATGSVDVIVVTYNSERQIADCVESFRACDDVNIVVVDNASADRTVEILRSLPVLTIAERVNRGFAAGCNLGWKASQGAYVLFLNPDATIDSRSLAKLVEVLDRDPAVGIVAPSFVYSDGRPAYYLRRFPRLTSTFARALFLHKAFPRVRVFDEVVRTPETYTRSGCHDWIPGTCLLVRRAILEALGGFDESFFMYCEDKDLCKRVEDAGYVVWYEPDAVCVHEGGASAPRSSLVAVMAQSRLRYVRKHSSAAVALLHRLGFALDALARVVVNPGGRAARAGHLQALFLLVAGREHPASPAQRRASTVRV